MNNTFKICKDCGIEKDIDLFYISSINKKTGKINYRGDCKECSIECNKENNKKYRQENKEKIKENNKEYNSKPENKEKIKENNKEYRQNNKEKISENKKEYNSKPENKEKINKRRKEKRENNPILKINNSVGAAISKDIKRNGGKKSGSKSKYLPWTFDELKEYFEFLFTLPGNEWMTWENYGEWHLDHIKPKSHFKIDSMEHPDFQKAWALENLRPLDAKQNISEGDRRTEEEIKAILNYIQTAKNKLKKKEDK